MSVVYGTLLSAPNCVKNKEKVSKTNITSPGLAPNIGVLSLDSKSINPSHLSFLKKSNLTKFGALESWVVVGTNSQINYATHGVYRYFGKFPAPIAAKLIETYTTAGETVLDPACGSGTTGVEALLSDRKANLFDINPLSVLISRVKTTPIAAELLSNSVARLKKRFDKAQVPIFETNEIDLNHWFLPETIAQLSNLKFSIKSERDPQLRDFLTMVFASIVRRVSKATTQQGRLFLDTETAIEEIWPVFEKSAKLAISRIGSLPRKSGVEVQQRNILLEPNSAPKKVPLVIYHPPYFNAYKYSSINSLEMAWLDFPRKETRKGEIREFFKVGKPENASQYVNDMVLSLRNIRQYLVDSGVVAMMIGDALMQGKHIDVTAQILNEIQDDYSVEKTVVRIPKYTEATWASSQRRNKGDLGITMFDFVIILRAK
jgi:site-specific DNA-methyltransferase (cytosine-N4-specific)